MACSSIIPRSIAKFKIVPVLTAVFRRRNRPVSTSWRMNEKVS
jgi:transposase-like protein